MPPPMDVPFLGILSDLPETVHANGLAIPVTIHLLDAAEEEDLGRRVDACTPSEAAILRARVRLAYAIRSIRGKPVGFGYADPSEEYEARVRWVAKWPAPLLEAAIDAYGRAERQPFLALEEAAADPP